MSTEAAAATTDTSPGMGIPIGEDFPEIRDSIRRVCADFPGAYWRDVEAKGAYPSEFVAALTSGGYLAVLIPEEYGGSGLSLRAASIILEEIHASGGNAGACHAQMYTMGTVLRHGSEAQKKLYLPKIAAGELRLQAFGVTEPTTGSDTTKLKTRAVRDGENYIVSGQKVWTSRALYSDLMLLLARTTPLDEVKRKTDGLSVFLVDMRAARARGMEIRPLAAMVNHNTTEVFFNDVPIPADSLIGQEGAGFRYILDGMNAERILVASESLGDGKWFIETAVNYAKGRVVFGRPIGQNQGIQFPLARAYAELTAAELVLRRSCTLYEAGVSCGEDANIAKLLTSEAAWRAGEACLQTHGGFGYAREYDVERKWRETRLYQIAPISTNMILAYVGEHVLGLPRSY
jgi:acyl-CoA dehydrogenase